MSDPLDAARAALADLQALVKSLEDEERMKPAAGPGRYSRCYQRKGSPFFWSFERDSGCWRLMLGGVKREENGLWAAWLHPHTGVDCNLGRYHTRENAMQAVEQHWGGKLE